MMSRAARWVVVLLLIGVALAWCATGAVGRSLAQDPAGPVIPLPLNERVQGRFGGEGEQATYRFQLPAGQDVVVAYEASAVVLDWYCVQLAGPDQTREVCHNAGGGGGGDPAVSIAYLIPGASDADVIRTVDLTLARPLEGPATYQLAAWAMVPQPVTLDEPFSADPPASEPFQVYALDLDPAQGFTLEVEDEAEDGAFMWVAHLPYLYENAVLLTDDSAIIAPDLDWGSSYDAKFGLQYMELYYAGGRSFRVMVEASGAYTVHALPLEVEPLVNDTPTMLTLSYRAPVRVLRFTPIGGHFAVAFDVLEGMGAIVRVRPPKALMEWFAGRYALALGVGAQGNSLPTTGTIELDVDGYDEMLVVVHVPYKFTRSEVLIEVTWQAGP